jgi:hypothetical protein
MDSDKMELDWVRMGPATYNNDFHAHARFDVMGGNQ